MIEQKIPQNLWRLSRMSRKFKYQKRQPKPAKRTLSHKEILIKATLRALFHKQREFWRQNLSVVITKNLAALGRKGHPREHGLHYAGRAWFRPWMEATTAADFTLVRVHPDCEKEVINVTSQLAELENEEYQVARFMAGMLLFEAPVLEYKKALGPDLVEEIENTQGVYFDSLHDSTGVVNNQSKALREYVQQNDFIVALMHERLMTQILLGNSMDGNNDDSADTSW